MVSAEEVRIVFYGFNPNLQFLFDRYRLHGRRDVVIVDPAITNNPAQITSADALRNSPIEKVIYWAHDIGQPVFDVEKSPAAEFVKGLSARNVEIATWAQPGKVHRWLNALANLSPEQLVSVGAEAIRRDIFPRFNYGYCVMLAAEQARRGGYESVTLIETGVWNGVGLLNLCEFCDFLTQTQGMKFRVFGFDTAAGLPQPLDWRDHPELWFGGSMLMPDVEALKKRLPDFCELIIGDVKDTIPVFAETQLSAESPLGFVSLDVDLYSASVDVLKVLEIRDPELLLPAVIMWVDDSNINILQNNFAGEALAISEFNHRNALRKIDHKVVRTDNPSRLWHYCIYFAHIFDHSVRQGKRRFQAHGYFHNHF